MRKNIFKLFALAVMVALLPAAAFATVTLKPATRAVPPTGGTGSVAAVFVSEAGAAASLAPTPSESWLTVVATQPASGTVPLKNGAGAGKVTYRVAANDSGVPRSATLTVAGATLTINQAGRPCRPAISAPVSKFAAGGGEASFNVTIAAGCPWTVTPPAGVDWVVVTEGESGTGSGRVTFTARENDDPVARTVPLSVIATHPVSEAVTGTKPHRVLQAKKTSATPLTVAQRVSVVDAKGGVGANGIRSLAIGLLADTGTDYERDVTRRFVEERSAEAFGTVNEILCMIAQSRYDAMLNKGPYTALIDAKLCRTDQESVTSETQAANQAPEYLTWTVDSSRASDSAPHVVKAWIHEKGMGPPEGGGMDMLIKARLTITEASSTENPFGIFSVDFAGYPVTETGPLPFPAMKGALRSERDAAGRVVLRFVEGEEGPGGGGQAAAFRKETDGSGSGSVASHFGDKQDAFDFAFSTSHFRRVTGESDVCLDRNAFAETAWRYGLYDESGARLNLASGFPIRVDKNGKRLYGWVGYWGVWLPGEAALADGDEVYRQTFTGEPDPTPYQVLAPGGKLMKHTRATTTLDDIRNTPLHLWLSSGPQGGGNYRAAWNGTTFVIDAFMGNQGWSFLPSPVTLDVSTLGQPELNFWSESLSGSGRVRLACTGGGPGAGFVCSAPAGSAEVIYYREEPVFPGDPVPASFACMEGCPDASRLSTDNPFRSDPNSFQNVPPSEAQYLSYPFDSTAMVLKDGSTPLVTATTAQQWGVRTGPLFEPTAENLALLACPWNSASTCSWQAGSELPVFYSWETGGNPWNRLTILVDPQGAPLRFDPPVRVAYLHSQSDPQAPDARYDGARMSLEYAGFGQLHGIPGSCYDETGNTVQCGEGTRFIADFMIPGGTVVTDERSGAPYRVKPLEIGQFMRRASSGCESLAVTPYALPSLSSWKDPAIGTEPAVAGAPAVVGGVLR